MIFNQGALIKVDSKRCLNQLHLGVNCNHCTLHCPTQALSINGLHILIDEGKCLGCGLCFSECPTQVFSEPQWNEKTIIEETKKQKAEVTHFFCENHPLPYRSKEQMANGAIQIPTCLSSISKGGWFEIGLETNIELHLDGCTNCSLKGCLDNLNVNIETASEWLVSSGHTPSFTYIYDEKDVKIQKKRKAVTTGMKTTSRRQLFLSLINQGSEMVSRRLNHLSALPDSHSVNRKSNRDYLPDWKRHLINSYSENFQEGGTPAYWPSIHISSNCSTCGMCSTNCPTQALEIKEEMHKATHIFNAGKCIDCRICQLFCPTDSIKRDREQNSHPFTWKVIKEKDPIVPCVKCEGIATSLENKTCYWCENEPIETDLISNVWSHIKKRGDGSFASK